MTEHGLQNGCGQVPPQPGEAAETTQNTEERQPTAHCHVRTRDWYEAQLNPQIRNRHQRFEITSHTVPAQTSKYACAIHTESYRRRDASRRRRGVAARGAGGRARSMGRAYILRRFTTGRLTDETH